MPLSFGYLRAPSGFVYPSKKRQLMDRKAGKRGQQFKKPFPIFNPYMRRMYTITIRYKWWIPPARNACRQAVSNFNNGRSLYQQIVGDRWAQQHGHGGNPAWMGMANPPISMLIQNESDGYIKIYCTPIERITPDTLRMALWREIDAESNPWKVVLSISVTPTTTSKTHRYALYRGVY